MKKYKIVVSYETTAVFEIEAETEEEATETVEDALLTYHRYGSNQCRRLGHTMDISTDAHSVSVVETPTKYWEARKCE